MLVSIAASVSIYPKAVRSPSALSLSLSLALRANLQPSFASAVTKGRRFFMLSLMPVQEIDVRDASGSAGEGGSRRQRERLCLCTLHFTNSILFPKHYYSNFSSISSWQNEDVSLGLSLRMGLSNEMDLCSRQHYVCAYVFLFACVSHLL